MELENGASRRDFMGVFAAFSAAFFVGRYVPGEIVLGEYNAAQQYPYPRAGWLEMSVASRPAFFTLENEAHRAFVFKVCQEHPLLRSLLHDELNDLLYADAPARRPRMGEYFENHVRRALHALKAWHPSVEPSLDNAVHVAMFTLAATLHPYLQSKEFGIDTVFGVSLPKDTTQKEALFTNAYMRKLPVVFPVGFNACDGFDDVLNRCLGWDRAIHLVQHMFVDYMYIYSRLHGLPDWKRMHLALRAIVTTPKDLMKEAALLSRIAGFVWEGKETGEGLADQLASLFGKPIVPGGYWDEMVRLDLAANDLGAHVGQALGFGGLTWEYLEEVFEMLNAPEVSKVVADPKYAPVIVLPNPIRK